MKFFKKFGILFVALFFIAIIAVLVLLGMKTINSYKQTISEQEASMSEMSSFIDNDIGPLTTCFTVNKAVRTGDVITEDIIEEVSIPEKVVYTEKQVPVTMYDGSGGSYTGYEQETALNFVTNKNDLLNKKFRVDLDEGALIMTDYVVDDILDNGARYFELTVDDFPTDIKAGDLVDIRIQFAYGEDFIALSHRKIEKIDITTGLITMIFDEHDMTVYNSMLLDKAMYDGVRIYMLKYVDSAQQAAAEVFYPINRNLTEIIKANPNILNNVSESMRLERAALNSILGGDTDTMDEKSLAKTTQQITQFRNDVSKAQASGIKERIKIEAAEAKARAKAEAGG